MTQTSSDLQAVAAALREHDRFLVVTHENPDGDALGSLLATTLALRQLGKDALMFLSGDAPLPREYAFMQLDGLRRELPDDMEERVLVAVDCAKVDRIGPDRAPEERARLVVNIDHHHDNSRFGDINLIAPEASSTGELLRDVFRELGVELTAEIAEPLYIALVTDTGRFQYSSTKPKSYRLAEVGAVEAYSEGIIDFLRAVEGAELAVLIREPPRDTGPARRVSLRASIDELDVSAIARAFGGGGHRQAAGFSSEASIDEITELIRQG